VTISNCMAVDEALWCSGRGSTLAFGSIGHGFESEHRLFSGEGE